MGIHPAKPAKRACEQDPEKLKMWFEEGYPEIADRAKKEKAEIRRGDETGVNNEAYNARGFSPKGKTPIIRLCARKSCINMISSITNMGKTRFMPYRETMTLKVLIRFWPG